MVFRCPSMPINIAHQLVATHTLTQVSHTLHKASFHTFSGKMGRFLNLFRAVFLVLLLVIGTSSGREFAEEARRKCESKSQRFKGLCFSKTNCGSVCKTEGFHGGHCRGFRRRCYCTKHC